MSLDHDQQSPVLSSAGPPASTDRPTLQLIDRQADLIVIDRRLVYGVAGVVALGVILVAFAALTGWPGNKSPGVFGSGSPSNTQALLADVNPLEGFTLPVTYGEIGPKLLAAGAIDQQQFIQLYSDSGNPLSNQEIAILTQGSDQRITITQQNAHFLLNLLWALGLTNRNPILDQGPLMENSNGEIEQFASTGGWTLGVKPVSDLYSSQAILQLTPKQQSLVDEAAANTYRPCCNNSTAFADCNHGMAMLGLYELMAAQGATLDEMYQAAKYFNAFWFPQQALQLATYFRATANQSFAEIDPRTIVSMQYSSASGAQLVQGWLAQKDLLPQDAGGGRCGV
jgi:hypothetical protein